MSQQFSGAKLRQGINHFLIGKVVSAGAGLAAMLLVIRSLSVSEFAEYSVLMALTELFTALAGLGISHAVLRYVPEFMAKQYRQSLRWLVGGGFGIRTTVLITATAFAWAQADDIAPFIGVDPKRDVLVLFLFVVLFRSTSHFLSQVLESILSQGWIQFAFSLNAVTRLIGMMWLYLGGEVGIREVVLVEGISDFLCMCILAGATYFKVWLSGDACANSNDDRLWFTGRLPAILRFACSGYLQHLAGLPFGGNTNRMVGGALFPSTTMASYGFAQSLYEYVKRYLPAQLFVGLIRPVMVARFSSDNDFPAAAKTGDRVIQVNLIILSVIFSVIIVGGEKLTYFISGGKYGLDSLVLLLSLLVVLVLESYRMMLEMIIHVIERYQILIFSNLLLAASVFPGIYFYPLLGAVALPLFNALALVLANAFVIRRLRSEGFMVPTNWTALVQMGITCASSVLFGHLLLSAGIHWTLATAASGGFTLWIAVRCRMRDLMDLRLELSK